MNLYYVPNCTFNRDNHPDLIGSYHKDLPEHAYIQVIDIPWTAQDLWKLLGDVPIDDDEAIDVSFLHFPKGTDRYEIWYWFEDTFDIGVHELMYPNEHK